MLQNLTNKPNYAKEQFMIPLNGFVEDNKERMTKFFNDLCEVEDFHEQLEVIFSFIFFLSSLFSMLWLKVILILRSTNTSR